MVGRDPGGRRDDAATGVDTRGLTSAFRATMDRDAFTRAERRTLRELAGEAWDRDLGAELARLEASFAEWRSGAISPHELSDRIHQFHNGAARRLYVLYTSEQPSHLVARAVAAGTVAEGEVPAELLAKLASTLAFYRERWEAPDATAAGDERDSPPAAPA